MEKGAEKSIPECLALYGWYQLCYCTYENALSALSHLQRAKDMKNAMDYFTGVWSWIVHTETLLMLALQHGPATMSQHASEMRLECLMLHMS